MATQARFFQTLRQLPFLHHMVLFVAISTLTRLVLAGMSVDSGLSLTLMPAVMLLGAWNDLLVLSCLLVPGFLWAALTPSFARHTRWMYPLRLVVFFFNAVALLFIALSELTFWEEFSTRFNFIAVDYLIYTHEVIGNLKESYAVGWLLSGVLGLAFVLTLVLRHFIVNAQVMGVPLQSRAIYLAAALVLPTFAWQASDVDQMEFSTNAYANELSGNGIMTFMAAFRRNELDYERFYATMGPEQADAVLQKLGVRQTMVNSTLKSSSTHSSPLRHPPKHVVMVMVESLSASYLGSFGQPLNLTPQLDALAKDGLIFTQMYATGTRTVRGLEALSLGTPPVPGQAIVRRPGNEHLSTLGEVLRPQGFEPMFFYGGYGYFDNMNAYFAGNNYKVIDRTGFPKETIGFENVWGIGDEFLFDNVLKQLDQSHASGKRFLAQVMTTSNHRPFTYADGRIDIPSPGGREGAVKYTDYSIGHFIEQAKKKPWFADTLFVIVADHCASAAGKTKLPIKGYHIPMVMYAPALLKPGRYTDLVSQIDIAPTLLDLLQAKGEDLFYGRSVFKQDAKFERRAFISNYQELGYYKNGQLTVLGPKRRVENFQISNNGDATPMDVNPTLRDEAIAYYQSASQAFKKGGLKFKQP